MASKITNTIPKSNFRLIRDKIALVIAEEFHYQVNTNNDLSLDVDTFIERFIPYSPEEDDKPIVNIMTKDVAFTDKTINATNTKDCYYIDVFCCSKINDSDSKDKNLRICEAIQYIFAHQKNEKLDGLCYSQKITLIQTDLEYSNTESANSSFSRLTIEVDSDEKTSAITGTKCDLAHTTFFIDNTDKGFIVKAYLHPVYQYYSGFDMSYYNGNYVKPYNQ